MRARFFMRWFALWLAVAVCRATGADAPTPAVPPAPANAPTNAPLKQIGPGLFQLGEVQFNKNDKTVTFPARVNMNEGLIEYLLVSTAGKTHESLLLTQAEPYHIHLAMLLLGAKGTPTMPAEQRAQTKTVRGDEIAIHVSWAGKDGKKSYAGEELIFNLQSKVPMSAGHWTYNGSWIFEGTFIAQRERSIVSIIHDHDALVNNPRPGREDDELWQARKEIVPAVGTPVEVTLKLQPTRAIKQ
ncbi:MAG: YdjY domain-containing protein [Verrucomicrobiota bacterium]